MTALEFRYICPDDEFFFVNLIDQLCILSVVTAGMPKDLRLSAIQAAVMLMPDENREVLQSLLLFLSDIAEHSNENQVKARSNDG